MLQVNQMDGADDCKHTSLLCLHVYLHNPYSKNWINKTIPLLMCYSGSGWTSSLIGTFKRTSKSKSRNGSQIFQQLTWRLYNHVMLISSNTLIHIQRGDCDISKANTPRHLRIFDALFYCSYHKWALITSISFSKHSRFQAAECCLQTRGVFWWRWLYASDYSNILHIMALHVCVHIPHTHARFLRLPSVSFLLSAFIWIKIRPWPDILLIWVVSFWRIGDLDEMSHPVKSDSKQHANVYALRASSPSTTWTSGAANHRF